MFNLPGQNRPSMPGVIGSFGVPIDTFHPAPGQGAGAPGSAARQARRLYVGNITTEATEEAISSFFNGKMKEMGLMSDKGLGEDLQGLGLVGDEPVISVHLNYEKNYAFVEVSSYFGTLDETDRYLVVPKFG